MNKKWRDITRRFYCTTRRSFVSNLLPPKLLEQLEGEADGDQDYPKLPFAVFVKFMVRALFTVRKKPSTRNLAEVSKRPAIQLTTGVQAVSHQAIADRLRSVDLVSLQTIFNHVNGAAHLLLRKQTARRGGLKLFDCTSVEVTREKAPWAADNGDKNAVRLAMGIHADSDIPSVVLNASETTSDNTVFPAIVNTVKRGQTLVLDAGFTSLDCFKAIMDRRGFFVARMANIYKVQVLRSYRKAGSERTRVKSWKFVTDERVRVGTPRYGGPLEIRRVTWRDSVTGKCRVIWTNRFDLTAKRVFETDYYRWRIETHFRWLKSELGLDHLPSFDVNGVQAFFLLLLLAWICLRVFDAQQRRIPVDRFSCPAALNGWAIAVEYYLSAGNHAGHGFRA